MPPKYSHFPPSGAALRKVRESCRFTITQQELADEMEVTVVWLRKLETGALVYEHVHRVWKEEYLRALGRIVPRKMAERAMAGNPIVKSIKRRQKREKKA